MIANQAAQHLSANPGQWRTSHFKFVNSAINGVPVLTLWKRYVRGMEGGDEKYPNPRAIYLKFLRCTESAPPPNLRIAIFPIHSTAALIP